MADQILLDNGAYINAEDSEGNTPLHVKCYGETDRPSEMECLELLLVREAVPTKRNNRVSHCFCTNLAPSSQMMPAHESLKKKFLHMHSAAISLSPPPPPPPLCY